MNKHPRAWLLATIVFTLVNAVGGGYAAALGEQLHAGVHVGLMFLGSYFIWRLGTRPERDGSSEPLAASRLEQLQQSVDVVAIEVERLGEAQRFNAKQQAERSEIRR